jgi:hypothetical protein
VYRNLSLLLLIILGLSSCASCSDMISHERVEKTPLPADNQFTVEPGQPPLQKSANESKP